VCGGVGREKVTVANGNHALPGRSARVGVTSDGAENAPRLRVTYGEDSQESVPPLESRVETHTASAQGSSSPVPWRWRSRGARLRELQGTSRPPVCPAHGGELAAFLSWARRRSCQGHCLVGRAALARSNKAVCGGGGSGPSRISVANGNHALPGRSARDGVTSDEAENAPRLKVTYGEDSKESKPPITNRVNTHTAKS